MRKDDLDRERYEARLKARRDRNAELKDAKEEGEKLGEDKGRKQGELIGRILAYEEILNRPLTSEEELHALTLEELTRLADELKKRALHR